MKIEIKMGPPTKDFPFPHFYFVDPFTRNQIAIGSKFYGVKSPYVGMDGKPIVLMELKEAVKYVKDQGDTPIANPN